MGYQRQQLLIAQLGLNQWNPAPYSVDIFTEHGVLSEERFIAKRMDDQAGEDRWFAFRIHKSKAAREQPLLTADDVATRFGQLSVWQVFHLRPALFDALALPVGYTVFINQERIESVLSETGESWSI